MFSIKGNLPSTAFIIDANAPYFDTSQKSMYNLVCLHTYVYSVTIPSHLTLDLWLSLSQESE
jgi:hypothetical protein